MACCVRKHSSVRVSNDEKRRRNYQIIIFGASGYIGRQIVFEAVDLLTGFNWAIAGRNQEKLESILRCVGDKKENDLSATPIIIADIGDWSSLVSMCKQCDLLVNCCGPYECLGKPVMRACIDSGTHYIDLSHEPLHLETMRLEYNDEARTKGVYAVQACGFQGFIMDIAVSYMRMNFFGTINCVEAFSEFSFKNECSADANPLFSKSAWISYISSYSSIRKVQELRSAANLSNNPELKPKCNYRGLMEKLGAECGVKGVCVPYPIIDHQIVESSQYFGYAEQGERPIQFFSYWMFETVSKAIYFIIACFVIAICSQIDFIRELMLIKYAHLISLGYISDCPDIKSNESIEYKITLRATGWSRETKQCNCDKRFKEEDLRELILTISGKNPIYGTAAICALNSAITVLEKKAGLPEQGGVFTPGVAFGKTDIVYKLQQVKNGPDFTLCVE